MPAIPLPFVIALLLAVLLLRLALLRERALRPAIGFVAACVVVAAIVGALLAHGARAWRSGQPAAGIHLHVGVSERRHPVRLRLR